MRVLGLDVGEKRIGVARADSSTRIAVPVGFVNVDGSEWQEITKIAKTQRTNFFVLGLPRSNEGNETKQSLFVRNFAKTLLEKIPEAKIRFQDESLTSVVAEERLKSRRKAYVKGEIDAEAAAIILQDFLEGLKRTDGAGVVDANQPSFRTRSRPLGQAYGPQEGLASHQQTDPRVGSAPKTPAESTNKKRKKGAVNLIVGLIVAALVAAGAVAGVMWYKDMKAKERAEYYAALEAQMEPEVFNFTIRPGETIFEVRDSLIEVGYSAAEVDAALSASYDFNFLKGRPEGATLEGYLYGETHEFYKDTPVTEVIETFLSGMEKVITENDLEARYAAQGLTLYEGITLASVVQKEAPTSEMPTVAQVFLTRLDYGIPLGSDVTVSYALDVVDPDRETYTDNQAALTVDSCYNTRVYGGLPCGPISNPGLAALLAVAAPSDTAYLYFLTGDDGLMYYSYTEAEHIQKIYSHCQDLCNVSL